MNVGEKRPLSLYGKMTYYYSSLFKLLNFYNSPSCLCTLCRFQRQQQQQHQNTFIAYFLLSPISLTGGGGGVGDKEEARPIFSSSRACPNAFNAIN
jgi:hypothetical protein